MEENQINVEVHRLHKERIYFFLTFLIATLVWIWLIYSAVKPEQVVEEIKEIKFGEQLTDYIFDAKIILGFLFFAFLSHFIAMAHIRMNGVKVGPNQFPEIAKAIEAISQRLGFTYPPSAFVITGHGLLNAFATRLIFRKMIVLYSDLVDALMEEKDQDQLEAVIAHEMGHHILNHTGLKEWFLITSDLFPVFTLALSRSREYSADRVMGVVISDIKVCERALVKLAAGKRLGAKVDVEEYVKQIDEEGGFFAWLAEKMATHPHLTKRVSVLRDYIVSLN